MAASKRSPSSSRGLAHVILGIRLRPGLRQQYDAVCMPLRGRGV